MSNKNIIYYNIININNIHCHDDFVNVESVDYYEPFC